MEEFMKRTHRLLRAGGVILKTPHIAAYLAQHDPKAYAQLKTAFYAFDDATLDMALQAKGAGK